MKTTLATALGQTFPESGNLPVGLGVNVHSKLFDPKVYRPLFDYVRFDLSGNDYSPDSLARANANYEGDVVWIVPDLVALRALWAAGIRGATVEGPNEPNQALGVRGALTPQEYVDFILPMAQFARSHGYTIIGPSLSSWIDVAWIIAAIGCGLLSYVDAVSVHPYGVKSDHQLWDLISQLRQAFSIPFLFTEFCLSPRDLMPVSSYPNLDFKTGSPQAVVLASIIKQSMFERVSFVVYDLPDTDPAVQLTDAGGKPTALFVDLMKLLLPSQAPPWMAANGLTVVTTPA